MIINKYIYMMMMIMIFMPSVFINCTVVPCNEGELNGSWWFLKDGYYWELCKNDKMYDVFVEDFNLISSDNSTFLFDKDSCIIEFDRDLEIEFKYIITKISNKTISMKDYLSNKVIIMHKILNQKYDSTSVSQQGFYSDYTMNFHYRMMKNKYGMKD